MADKLREADLLLEKALQETEDLEVAEKNCKVALNIKMSILGENHPDLVEIQTTLAQIVSFSDPDRAEKIYKACLVAEKERKDAEGCIEVLQLLALHYLHHEKLYEAQETYKQIIHFAEKTKVEGFERIVAVSTANIGKLCLKWKKAKEAQEHLVRALKLFKEIKGDLELEGVATGSLNEDKDYLSTLHSFAELFELRREFSKAIQQHKIVLQKRLDAFGPTHPDTVTSVNALGELYRAKSDYDSAEKFFKHSLELTSALFPDSPELAKAMNNLGITYAMQGRVKAAYPLLKQSLEMFEKSLGHFHPELLSVLQNLEAVYHQTGEKEKAAQMHERIQKLFDWMQKNDLEVPEEVMENFLLDAYTALEDEPEPTGDQEQTPHMINSDLRKLAKSKEED